MNLIRKGSVGLHHTWPLEDYESYEKIKKIIGGGNISRLFVDLGLEWLRKQEGSKDESKVIEPKSIEPPKVTSSSKELGKWLDTLSLNELGNAQAYFKNGLEMANYKWKAKKFPPKAVESPLLLQNELRQIDPRNLESA